MTETAKKPLFYRTKQESERASLAAVLDANGFKRHSDDIGKTHSEAPVIVINTTEKIFRFMAKSDKTMLSIPMSMIIKNEFRKKKNVSKKTINSRVAGYWNSYVDTDGLHVGCQTISFDQIDDIKKKADQIREELKGGLYVDL